VSWRPSTAGAALSKDGLQLTYVERTGQPSSSEVLGALYAAQVPVLDVETRRSRLEDILISVLRKASA
jgi:ABC-2 type transport system ATP-binding protein